MDHAKTFPSFSTTLILIWGKYSSHDGPKPGVKGIIFSKISTMVWYGMVWTTLPEPLVPELNLHTFLL